MKMKTVLLLSLILLAAGGSAFAQGPNNARMLSTPNSQTGTTYTFVPADTTRVTTFNNASPVAVSLPNGATFGFGPGTMLSVVNVGAGSVTITCSICTINGAATLILSQNQGADLYGGYGAPAVNYIALSSPAGSNIAILNASNAFTGNNTQKNSDAVRFVDAGNPQGWAGGDPGAWINSAEADLPSTGGVIDARGLTGAQTLTTGIVFTKKTRLLLGAGTYTGPSSGDEISVQGGVGAFNQGTCIVGLGQNITILQPVTTAQAHGIHFTPTNNGNTGYCVEDLAIEDSTQGGTTRTAGAGIFADANVSPAQNSIGLIQNVVIGFMFNGIFLNRPITTAIVRSEVVSSKSDGVVLQGDGTTVTLVNVFSHSSGRHDFAQHGVNAVDYINSSAQGAIGDGIHIDRQSGTSGNQAVGTNILGHDIEVEGGKGIYCLDCVGLNITGVNLQNNVGDGIHIDGGRGVSLGGGQVKGSTGCGIDVTTSATPLFPAIIINQGTQLVGNIGGNECGAALGTAYDSFGYDGSAVYRINREIQLGPGGNTTPLTFGENTPPAGLAGSDRCYGDSTQHALECNYNNGGYFPQTQTIGRGSVAMTTALIGSGACGTTVTATATGAATTDRIAWSWAGAIGANPGVLILQTWPTSGNVNFEYCNPTAAGITPSAATLNWEVVR